jgi:tetratricopeptide (TPR) repeat protein
LRRQSLRFATPLLRGHARAPLDWATTQTNLGNAIQRLGERERGSERLEEAVAAYRDALKERIRERVPLDWAISLSNQGRALMLLSCRTKSGAVGQKAFRQIELALETMRGAGHTPFVTYYEAHLADARQVCDELKFH